MIKDIIFAEDARTKILSGVEQLTKAVKATMGPKGRNVIIQAAYGVPTVTRDGVSVAKEIELEDKFENMGAQLVKEAATKTNDAAGDGTTTATVLAFAIMQEGIKHINAGANAIGVKRGIDKAVTNVVEMLDMMKEDVNGIEDYKAIANISAHDEEIGEAIADVVDKAGGEGVITVESGQTVGIEIDFVEGMQFENGYLSPYFVTDTKKMECELRNPAILITSENITSIEQILPIIELLTAQNKKEIVIICDGMEQAVLATLVVNRLRGTFAPLVVKAPSFGDRRKEILEDIAAVTGARVISQEVGLKLETMQLSDLGTCKRIVAEKDHTKFIDGAGSKKDIEARISKMTKEIETSHSDFDKEKLAERRAKLKGGVAVVRVGANTDVEQKEKKDRVEDALSATRAAAKEGIVAGGGTALILCSKSLAKMKGDTEDETIGIEIVCHALSAPLKIIAENAGADPEKVYSEVLKKDGNVGYNALTGKYEDLVIAKVIDPKMVTRTALENAASVASMFLTLECAIGIVPLAPNPNLVSPEDLK